MVPSVPDKLRSAGLRRTPVRVAVLAQIEGLARPLAHADLLALPALVEVDPITLYRTLACLVEAGLVHRVFGIDGVWRYCAQPRGREGCPGNHAHFLCTACGSMTCLLGEVMPRVQVPSGAEVHGRHFLVFGRCVGCVTAPPAPHLPGDPG